MKREEQPCMDTTKLDFESKKILFLKFFEFSKETKVVRNAHNFHIFVRFEQCNNFFSFEIFIEQLGPLRVQNFYFEIQNFDFCFYMKCEQCNGFKMLEFKIFWNEFF